jgi:CheY-like chemotaxis protein
MPHLVLAEDSPTIQKLVQLCFKSEDIDVHCFEDGTSTLEYLKTGSADVLLADVAIPGLDGYELCRAVKQNPKTASTPVVLLVGVFDGFDVQRAEQVGYDRRLTKPLGALELVDLVKKLLEATDGDLAFPVHSETGPGDQQTVFSLTPFQCQARSTSYIREVSPHRADPKPLVEDDPRSAPDISLNRQEVDFLIKRLFELLEPELRRMVTQMTRDVVKRGAV